MRRGLLLFFAGSRVEQIRNNKGEIIQATRYKEAIDSDVENLIKSKDVEKLIEDFTNLSGDNSKCQDEV
ncbi:MAG: hypothetical protein LN588_03165 [Rickettsia endosymbiont of Bryobia graminum]|nr:hypothetical protein [Rickettsia endosymbiont of Bryobia graminum]